VRPALGVVGGRELEACADTVLEKRLREPRGERVRGLPAGAVRRHEIVRREIGEGVAGRLDQGLESRTVEMEAADDRVEALATGELLHVAERVDDTGVAATREHDKAAPAYWACPLAQKLLAPTVSREPAPHNDGHHEGKPDEHWCRQIGEESEHG
jgi:hypothetical protein